METKAAKPNFEIRMYVDGEAHRTRWSVIPDATNALADIKAGLKDRFVSHELNLDEVAAALEANKVKRWKFLAQRPSGKYIWYIVRINMTDKAPANFGGGIAVSF